MKRGESNPDPTTNGSTWIRLFQILALLAFLYLNFFTFQLPFIITSEKQSNHSFQSKIIPIHRKTLHSKYNIIEKQAPNRPLNVPLRVINSDSNLNSNNSRMREYKTVSGLNFDWKGLVTKEKDGFSSLHKSAITAFQLGEKLWSDILTGKAKNDAEKANVNRNKTCPNVVVLNGGEFLDKGRIMVLPCGLTLGSHITVIGKPKSGHVDMNSKIIKVKNGENGAKVSQFMMELIVLSTIERENPARILHYNPRLRGDWSGKPAIEVNDCYDGLQWGVGVRCDGVKSKPEDETVDGLLQCEKWRRDEDSNNNEQSKARWWLSRLLSRPKKVTVNWPYPYAEDKLFVMTMSVGLEGYHVSVDGRHVTSFPYRTGFSLEDATGLTMKGDIDIHSIFVASLPSSHPSFAPQRRLEVSLRWRAPPLPVGPVELFIGILSASTHFAERMAVRKSWMQHILIKSSKVVARFFVALNARNEINVELKKEADFFGDIVMVPYMDSYDLVVVKTVAVCEYGVRTVEAKYIMKCDDDTFVRVDAVINEANKIPRDRSFYVGNINYYHKPLRHGKWAVTYEEWPDEDYPPYANGPGYVLSSDVAHYIVSEFENHKLRLFKKEDVSMGKWVKKFNKSKRVEYKHSLKYCQFGCIEGYYIAHFQSPKQMICLWNKLQRFGLPLCCNLR